MPDGLIFINPKTIVMKKILLMLLTMGALSACSYNDSDIWKELDNLKSQVAELQKNVDALNSDVKALKDLVSGKQFISDVKAGEDGTYTLTLVTPSGETTTIVVGNGTGRSSIIGVKQDSDGVYYWTLDGEFIIADGHKFPVSGITPEFKVENGHWFISWDGGKNWSDCGEARNGQNLFKTVSVSEDGKLVYLTLTDGTVLTFEIYMQFGISFGSSSATIRAGESAEIPFTLTGADDKTDIQALADGEWKAEIHKTDNKGGTIRVTAPSGSSTGKVVVLANDGGTKTLMRTLTFISGILNVSTTSKEVPAAGGQITVSVETDLDYTVSIPEEASWIVMAKTKSGEIRHESLVFDIAANPDPEPRKATVDLISGGSVIESILIYQPGYYNPDIMVLSVEAKQRTSATYNNKVYLPLFGNVDVTVNWGDGQTEEIKADISGAAAIPNHTYTVEGIYTVTVSGYAEKLYGKLINKNAAPAILEIRQWGRLGMKALEYVFYNNSSLRTVPLPENDAFSEVTSASNMFAGCSSLESIPEGLFDNATGLTDVNDMFYGCSKIKEVPAGIFEKNTAITEAAGLFSGCAALEVVPAGLLDKMQDLKDLSNLFKGCKSLKSIPDNFFINHKDVTSLSMAFNDCASMESIPAGLFDGMDRLTNIYSMFKGCSSLKSIGNGAFDSFGEVTRMTGLFSGCSSLGSLPDDLFGKMAKVTDGGYLYEGCVSLTKFPSLQNCVSLTTVPALWKDCTQLVEAPADYFPESVKKGISSAYIFKNCTSLKTVPEGLFKNFEGVTTILEMFLNCTSLESLPADIFDNMKLISTTGSAFKGCSSFTGESPYTTVDVDGEKVKVHLYERADYPNIFGGGKKIFDKASSYKDTFKGCKSMSDYAFIPIAWGGISDGTKAKPVIELSAEPTEGKEYYQITVQIHSKEMKSCKVVAMKKSLLPELIEQMGDLEKVMNRYGNPVSSSAVAEANSDAGATFYFSVESDSEFVVLVSGTNVHGTTIEQKEVTIPAIPKGDAGYERYTGTWTVTSTSSEINGKSQTYTIEISPYRTNESFLVKGWGITTLGDDYPFILEYTDDGGVSIPSFDYVDSYGMGAYVYIRYRFFNASKDQYLIYTTKDALMTGSYDTGSGTVTLEGKKFVYNDTEQTVSGMDYVVYNSGQYVIWPELFKKDYTIQDYGTGPFKLTKVSSSVSSASTGSGLSRDLARLVNAE